MGSEIFHHTQRRVKESRLGQQLVGDEGGFAPKLKSNEHAIELLLNAIEKSNYRPEQMFS